VLFHDLNFAIDIFGHQTVKISYLIQSVTESKIKRKSTNAYRDHCRTKIPKCYSFRRW